MENLSLNDAGHKVRERHHFVSKYAPPVRRPAHKAVGVAHSVLCGGYPEIFSSDRQIVQLQNSNLDLIRT